MRRPRVTPYRVSMLVGFFVALTLVLWLPYILGAQPRWWIPLVVEVVGLGILYSIYFFNWSADDKRQAKLWNVWLVSDSSKELLVTMQGGREAALAYGQNVLMRRCWNSELGIVVGTVEVEPTTELLQ